MPESLRNWIGRLDLGPTQQEILYYAVAIVGILLVSYLANLIAKRIILVAVARFADKTRTQWDNILVESRFFTRFSHLAPALVVWALAPSLLAGVPQLVAVARRGAEIYMLVVALLVLDAFLNAVQRIYSTFEISQRIPIRSYIQVTKIVIFAAAGILTLSITLDKSPWVFLSGLGAITAILLLIFKDTILGLVAGIQLAAHDMVRPGDWIEMPKYGADGDVSEVSLNTIKVRNWDKTITTIPSYALISDSFKNWRGMTESGGRRIKRAVHVDVNSIRFCTPEMIERFSRIEHIREYVKNKQAELERHNREHGIDDSVLVNGRRMTNVGTFRAYVVAYLKAHPKIHQELTFLVRQLAPNERGLPIEIYVFSNDQAWANYEAIQSDIFDHLLAVLPEFDLRPFQNPTGHDIKSGLKRLEDPAA